MDEVNDLKPQLERRNKELADAREDINQYAESSSLWCDKANWALRRLSDEDRALSRVNGFAAGTRAEWQPEKELQRMPERPEGVYIQQVEHVVRQVPPVDIRTPTPRPTPQPTPQPTPVSSPQRPVIPQLRSTPASPVRGVLGVTPLPEAVDWQRRFEEQLASARKRRASGSSQGSSAGSAASSVADPVLMEMGFGGR